MRGKRILFFDPDPRARRVAERSLAATGSEVRSASDLAELTRLADDGRWDLLMLSYDPPLRDDGVWSERLATFAQRWPDTRLVLHSTAPTEDYLPLMASRPFLRNVIAKNDDPLEPDELIITAEKLLRGELFGLQKYLLWGIEPYRVEIRDSRRKPEYVQEVATYAETLGCNERVIDLVETVVDELVTNAIYNAPRTADGQPKYAQLSRREPVTLDDDEVGQLEFACDGDYIAIAQIDRFGALTPATVVSYLSRWFAHRPEHIVSEASGGAGIGLFRVFQSLSKLVINIDPGRRTEVICLLDLRLTMKRFRQAAKSFHIFVTDRPEPATPAAPGPEARDGHP
jgi:CheY-like chemotaxis protein